MKERTINLIDIYLTYRDKYVTIFYKLDSWDRARLKTMVSVIDNVLAIAKAIKRQELKDAPLVTTDEKPGALL